MTLNEHYTSWAADPSSDNLNALLTSARAQALRYARVQKQSDPDDIAQDAAIAVFTERAKFDPKRGSFSSWVTLLTKRAIKNRFQKEDRRPSLVAPDPEPDSTLETVPTGDPVAKLILEGHTLSAIQLILGFTRKGLRCHIAKLRRQGPN